MRQIAHRLLPCLLALSLGAPSLAHAEASSPASTLQPLAEAELRAVVGAGSDLAGALGGAPARPSSNADERALQALEDALKFHDRREAYDQHQRAMQTAAAALTPVTTLSMVGVATLPLGLVGFPLLGLLSLAQLAPQAPRDSAPLHNSP
jgi:hypothetical protein